MESDARGSGTGARFRIHRRRGGRGLSRAAFATRRSSYIRYCELRGAGRTVRERLEVCPSDRCDDGFSVMPFRNTDQTAEGDGHGSRHNCLRRAAAALIHAGIVERWRIRADRCRDFRRLAGAVCVTVCRMLAGCRMTMDRMWTVRRMLNMSTAGHVSTGHTGQSRGEPNTPRANEYAGPG
jgi:hypothetical protein